VIMTQSPVKSLLIWILSINWINKLVVALVKSLPAAAWRARIPVMGEVARLDLRQGRTVCMVRADKCSVAREVY
jgi:hypothetical protein